MTRITKMTAWDCEYFTLKDNEYTIYTVYVRDLHNTADFFQKSTFSLLYAICPT